MSTCAYVVAIAALTLCLQGVVGETTPFQDVLGDALNKTGGLAAQAASQSAGQQLQTIVHSLVMSGEGVLNSSRLIVQGLADTLEEAVKKALGELPECITDQQSDAARLFSNTLDGVWRCVTDRVTQVGLLVVDVADLAGQAFLLPHRAAANITACLQRPLTSVFCTAEAVGAWGFASEEIVARVAADVNKGEQLFVDGPRDIAACAASQVDAAAAAGQEIIVSIAQCVVDGSNASTTDSATW